MMSRYHMFLLKKFQYDVQGSLFLHSSFLYVYNIVEYGVL